jgi:hypothetical protein
MSLTVTLHKLHALVAGALQLSVALLTPCKLCHYHCYYHYCHHLTDIVNGKTKIVEQAFEMTSSKTGYSAVYYYNSINHYQLAASVLGLANGSLTVDVELPSTKWSDELRLSELWIVDDKITVTTRAELHGHRYVVSARCVTMNTMITLEGAEPYPFDWRGEPTKECTAYMIQGLPWSDIRPTGTWLCMAVGVCDNMCTEAAGNGRRYLQGLCAIQVRHYIGRN